MFEGRLRWPREGHRRKVSEGKRGKKVLTGKREMRRGERKKLPSEKRGEKEGRQMGGVLRLGTLLTRKEKEGQGECCKDFNAGELRKASIRPP